MIKKYTTLIALAIFTLLFSAEAFAQKSSISGIVFDRSTEARLPGANILVENRSAGTVTNVNGTFRIRSLEPGSVILQVSYLGYQTQMVEVYLEAGETSEIEIGLSDSFVEMDGIVV